MRASGWIPMVTAAALVLAERPAAGQDEARTASLRERVELARAMGDAARAAELLRGSAESADPQVRCAAAVVAAEGLLEAGQADAARALIRGWREREGVEVAASRLSIGDLVEVRSHCGELHLRALVDERGRLPLPGAEEFSRVEVTSMEFSHPGKLHRLLARVYGGPVVISRKLDALPAEAQETTPQERELAAVVQENAMVLADRGSKGLQARDALRRLGSAAAPELHRLAFDFEISPGIRLAMVEFLLQGELGDLAALLRGLGAKAPAKDLEVLLERLVGRVPAVLREGDGRAALMSLLEHPQPDVRIALLDLMLNQFPKEFASRVAAIAGDPSSQVREWFARNYLPQAAWSAELDRIARALLWDVAANVRVEAVVVLVNRRLLTAVECLRILREEVQVSVRMVAMNAIDGIEASEEEFVQLIEVALADPNHDVVDRVLNRMSKLWSLQQRLRSCSDERIEAAFRLLASHPAQKVRQQVPQVIYWLWDGFIPTLCEHFLEDSGPDESFRVADQLTRFLTDGRNGEVDVDRWLAAIEQGCQHRNTKSSWWGLLAQIHKVATREQLSRILELVAGFEQNSSSFKPFNGLIARTLRTAPEELPPFYGALDSRTKKRLVLDWIRSSIQRDPVLLDAARPLIEMALRDQEMQEVQDRLVGAYVRMHRSEVAEWVLGNPLLAENPKIVAYLANYLDEPRVLAFLVPWLEERLEAQLGLAGKILWHAGVHKLEGCESIAESVLLMASPRMGNPLSGAVDAAAAYLVRLGNDNAVSHLVHLARTATGSEWSIKVGNQLRRAAFTPAFERAWLDVFTRVEDARVREAFVNCLTIWQHLDRPAVVARFEELLDDESERIRIRALAMCDARGNEQDVKRFLAALKDPAGGVRRYAASCLGKVYDLGIVDALLEARLDPESTVREAAEESLKQLRSYFEMRRFWSGIQATGAEDPIVEVLAMLADEDRQVRLLAIESLGSFGSPQVLPRLLRIVKSGAPEERAAAARAIERINRAAGAPEAPREPTPGNEKKKGGKPRD